MLRRKLSFLILFLLAGCFTGNGVGQPNVNGVQVTLPAGAITPIAATPMPLPDAPPGSFGAGAGGFEDGVNPYTGLPADAAALDRRPLLVKISNAPSIVRPQAGLDMADLVFEHYAEGGLTRFSALFYSETPPRIGSIRSARLIDLELIPMLHALFGYSGASDGVLGRIRAADFLPDTYSSVDYGGLYSRDPQIDPPHNLFLDPAALWAAASAEGRNNRPTLEGLTFRSEPPSGGAEGGRIDFSYIWEHVVWEYDAGAGVYRRFSDDVPHTDALTGAQVSAANVILLYAPHHDTDIVESVWQGQTSYSIEVDLQGEGAAVVYRDGLRYDARWVRRSRDAILTFIAADGTRLPLKPGITWVQVLPAE